MSILNLLIFLHDYLEVIDKNQLFKIELSYNLLIILSLWYIRYHQVRINGD